MDFWPDRDFNFNHIFNITVNPKKTSPEVVNLRQELNEFKTELKPWLQEIGDSRIAKLNLLKNFLNEYVVSNPSGKLSVKEFNPMIVKYVKMKSGLPLETISIKGLMESLFNKSKDDVNFWYKGDKYFSGILSNSHL